jgi:Mn-dependent DtxR family transcriptional regulator
MATIRKKKGTSGKNGSARGKKALRAPLEGEIIVLLKKKPLNTLEVAAALGIERHTAVKYLESMESRGEVRHETKRRAKIWSIARPNIISAIKKNDPLIRQFSEILDNVDEHINIQNERHEVIWKNEFAKHDHLKCWNKAGYSDRRCKNCPVETTFSTGKPSSMNKSCHGKHKRIVTKPIKDEKNRTVAVVEIIKDEK